MCPTHTLTSWICISSKHPVLAWCDICYYLWITNLADIFPLCNEMSYSHHHLWQLFIILKVKANYLVLSMNPIIWALNRWEVREAFHVLCAQFFIYTTFTHPHFSYLIKVFFWSTANSQEGIPKMSSFQRNSQIEKLWIC